MTFQNTVESTIEVISKLEKKQICPESCTKKSSFLIIPSYDFVEFGSQQWWSFAYKENIFAPQSQLLCLRKTEKET